MTNTVVGVFDNVLKAEEAAQELVYHGFNRDKVDISATSENSYQRNEAQKGGIGKFFDSLFGDPDESNRYSSMAERGSVVTVHTDSMEDAKIASQIMDQYGALDVNKQSQSPSQPQRRTEMEPGDRTKDVTKDMTIPIIEEQMEVGKKKVETESVQVRSRIIEKPVEEHLRLRVDKIYVERKPVSRPASEADLTTFKEGTITATESEEVPIVKKEANVVEEVKIKKVAEEKGKTVRGSVRKQDIDVERKSKDKMKDVDRDIEEDL